MQVYSPSPVQYNAMSYSEKRLTHNEFDNTFIFIDQTSLMNKNTF
jgi:hypothetical protein